MQQPAAWLFGEVGADHSTDSTTENETTAQHPRPAVIDDAKGGAQRWNPNCFLVPMLWMEMRELAQATSSASTQDNVQRKRVDVAELAHLIESTSASWLRQTSSAHAPPLPLMMGLSADSMDAAPWNSAMTVDLLSIAPIRDDHDNEHGRRAAHIFEEDSFTLWHILKDSFAFTPGLYDAWDTTMEAMKAGGMEVANPL
uniref:Uncharacterized protein n=1 Tax=Craspedostauros australis TaxID=1486917 RepID=A0A7R9WUE5_9STRA